MAEIIKHEVVREFLGIRRVVDGWPKVRRSGERNGIKFFGGNFYYNEGEERVWSIKVEGSTVRFNLTDGENTQAAWGTYSISDNKMNTHGVTAEELNDLMVKVSNTYGK